MRLTSTKKIVVEDYAAESRPLIQKLAQTLNSFLDQVTSALSNNVTIADNLKAHTSVHYLMAGVSTFTINWALNERPTDVRIAQLARTDGSTPTDVFALHWTYANGVISCTVLGLDAAKVHNLTIVGQV